MQTASITISENRWMRYFYVLNIFFAALTGFGQMPIYKRYYMSDIPGFAWLADFYLTRYVHYLSAVLLLALVSYFVFDFVFIKRKHVNITRSGYFRGVLLAGIVITGVLFVIKNFAILPFSPQFITFLDLCHLGFVMLFLLVNLYCLVFKKKWTTSY